MVKKEIREGFANRLIVGVACASLMLAVFDWKYALLKQPQGVTVHIEHSNKRIRDALTTAVIGKTVNESDFLDRFQPLNLATLHGILTCDRFSVESLLENLNQSIPGCHEVMTKVFDRQEITSIDHSFHVLEQFFSLVKTPGATCQLHERFKCDNYGAAENDEKIKDPKIAIVVIAADVVGGAMQLSIENKEQYASMHGLDVHILRNVPAGFTRGHAWAKIPFMASLLHKYDYLWSLDLDTIILDMSFDIKRLIDDRFDLVVGVDPNGINTGSFLIKNSVWSSLLLHIWWLEDDVEPLGWWEQAAIHKLSRNVFITNHIKQIRQEDFNSYEGDVMRHPEKLPFVLHFPGDGQKWSKVIKYTDVLKNATGRQDLDI